MALSNVQYKIYLKRTMLSTLIIFLIAASFLLVINYSKPDIEIENIQIKSIHSMINDVYFLEVGDEVTIEINVKNVYNKEIRYLEVNHQVYQEKDIIYDNSYMELDQVDNKTRKLTVVYIVKNGDTKIEVKDVKLYLKGIIYLGQKLDLQTYGLFDISIENFDA